MAKAKDQGLTVEERLVQALVSEEEQPYEVPKNWVWTRLIGILAEIKNGTTVTQNKDPIGAKVTRIESIQNNRIDYDRLGYIADLNTIKSTDWYFANDIALSHINSAEHVGKTALIAEDLLPLVHGMNLLRLRFNKACNPKYFYYFSQSFQYKLSILERINMAVNQVSINQKQINDIEFPLPPLAEQLRIVESIDSLFEKLGHAKELAQKALDTFETRKAAILHKAFVGELTKKWRDENGIGMECWKKATLGKLIFPMITKKPNKDKQYFRYIDIYAIDNITQTVRKPKELLVSEAPSRASRGVETGNVLFSLVRPYLKNIALIDEELSDCIVSTGFYVCRCKPQLDCRFLYQILRSQDTLNYYTSFMKGDNSPSIRKDDFEGLLVYLPSLEEQQEIVRILDSLFEKEQRAEEVCDIIEKIDLMKKTILARAFRGELGTNDPNEESAVELLKQILA